MGLLLIAGGVAELAHVSGGIVAFLVGLSMSGSIAQRARELLSPLRDLFAALFFVTFGYLVDGRQIPDVLLVAVAALGGDGGHQDRHGLGGGARRQRGARDACGPERRSWPGASSRSSSPAWPQPAGPSRA